VCVQILALDGEEGSLFVGPYQDLPVAQSGHDIAVLVGVKQFEPGLLDRQAGDSKFSGWNSALLSTPSLRADIILVGGQK
jgi:hypothetical protein